MQIVTWNVNSIRVRAERALAWIDRVQPDLICLQELKCQDEQFPREGFAARGYHLAMRGQKTYNGVGVLSRRPFDAVEPVIPIADDPQARGISVQVGDLRVVDLYVPNGQEVGSEAYSYKLRWLDGLLDWLSRTCRPDEQVILCGDFNIAPDDRDVYDPELWRERVLCSTPERERLQALMAWGLSDALRHFTDAPAQYTWWDYRNLGFQKREGLRIDHFLVSAPVLARAKGVEIDRDERREKKDQPKPSDHAPVKLILE